MNLIEVVTALKKGKCEGIKRSVWNKTDYYILNPIGVLVHRSDYSIQLIPCTQSIEATDWELVPKPKVKRKVEGWINVMFRGSSIEPVVVESVLFNSKQTALNCRHTSCEYLGDPLFISHVYEVEE
jgi:hypothetical protein